MDTLSVTTMGSPVGELTLVASATGLRALLWPQDRPERVRIGDTSGAGVDAEAILARAQEQLREYFEGERRSFELPLDPHGTAFQLKAWRVLQTIVFGETLTYGEQAERMGGVNKARAVGAANGRNPISIVVPCHRVIGTSGRLTGYAGGLEAKSWLLRHEQRVVSAHRS